MVDSRGKRALLYSVFRFLIYFFQDEKFDVKIFPIDVCSQYFFFWGLAQKYTVVARTHCIVFLDFSKNALILFFFPGKKNIYMVKPNRILFLLLYLFFFFFFLRFSTLRFNIDCFWHVYKHIPGVSQLTEKIGTSKHTFGHTYSIHRLR